MIPLAGRVLSDTPRLCGLCAEARQRAQDTQFGLPYAAGSAGRRRGAGKRYSLDDEDSLRAVLEKLGFLHGPSAPV
jgi:hypothetical protein